MSRVLVCAATDFELAAWGTPDSDTFCLVSGVGIPATYAALPSAIERHQPKRLINIGIAGAYPETGLQIGDIVVGESDVFGDIGFELPETPYFQPIQESTFGTFYATVALQIPEEFGTASLGRGCTVSTCTGQLATGTRRRDQFNASFETMEGAAVGQIGASYQLEVVQIRAISNIAADRDMQRENILRSVNNLTFYLRSLRGTLVNFSGS